MKAKENAPLIKLGGGSFRLDYVLSFETPEAFIAKHKHWNCSRDMESYLLAIWNLAHRSEDFRQKSWERKESEQTPVTGPETTPKVIKQATKRKSTAKKE